MESNEHTTPDVGVEEDLSLIKRKLAWRMGIAGTMIVGLLGSLAIFDRLTSTPSEQEMPASVFTEPVPVAKKSVTQPVTPVEQIPDELKEEKKDVAPESTSAPTDRKPPIVEPASLASGATSSSSGRNGRPVARPQASTPAPAPASPSRPVESKGDVASVVQSRPDAPETIPSTAPASQRQPQVLSKVLSGYALQAGVFSDSQRAEELRAKLVAEGIPATLETRVLVGPFNDRAEADAARVKMQAMGVSSVLLPKSGKK